jgi:hypothetical protein
MRCVHDFDARSDRGGPTGRFQPTGDPEFAVLWQQVITEFQEGGLELRERDTSVERAVSEAQRVFFAVRHERARQA